MISRIFNKDLSKLYVIIVLALIRFINLDADPGIFKWGGDITEGYYANNARNIILYHQFITDEYNVGASLAPLYTLSSFLFFKLFSVSNYTLRLTSAIFGILTILLSYLFLKKYNKDIAFWGSLFLALNYSYFIYTRIGFVEVFQSFFILLTFFLLERKNWFAGGLGYGLVIAAKNTGFLFLPAVVLYFFFMLVKKEINLRAIFQFAGGGLVIGLLWITYQWYFSESFGGMHQYFATRWILEYKNILPRLIHLFFDIYNLNRNFYFINPVNILLLIVFIIYLIKIKFLNIFSKNFIEYIKNLDNLDIIIISWIFGYTGSLLLLSGELVNEVRFGLLSVVLSFIPAILLFRKKEFKYYNPEIKKLGIFVSIIPIIFLIKEITYYLLPGSTIYIKDAIRFLFFPHRTWIPFPQDNVFIITFIPLILITALSIRHKKLSDNIKRHLIEISIFSLITVMNYMLYKYLNSIFIFNNIVIILLSIIIIYFLVIYIIYHNIKFIIIIYAISLFFILINLFNPQFSVRDASLKLGQITSKDDYLMGIDPFSLSYNAEYHPVWWHSDMKINDDFIKKVKPKYYILWAKDLIKLYSDNVPVDQNPNFQEKILLNTGAKELEKIYSFKQYSVFGKYDMEHWLYIIIY